MSKQLTVHQASVLLFVVICASKLMMLPSLISYQSANDAWLVFLLSFVIDFLFSLLMIYIIEKVDDNLFVFLKKRIGKILTIFIAILIALLFVLKCTQFIGENYVMFDEKMYIEMDKPMFLLAITFFVVYLGSRNLNSIGRTMEILIYIIGFSIVLSFIISFNTANLENIFPFLNSGVKNIVKNSFNHCFWFGDFLIMLFFVGNIKKEKHMHKKLVSSYLLSVLVVMAIVVVFICVFSRTAPMHRTCILDIAELEPRLLSEGRFNWIVDFIFPIVSVFLVGLYSYFAIHSIQFCIKDFFKSNKTISVLLFLFFLGGFVILFRFNYNFFYDFLTNIASYYCLAIQYILSFAIFLLSIKCKSSLNGEVV